MKIFDYIFLICLIAIWNMSVGYIVQKYNITNLNAIELMKAECMGPVAQDSIFVESYQGIDTVDRYYNTGNNAE